MLMFFFSSLIHRPSPHHFWCLTWQHKHKMIKAVGNWITVKVVSSQAKKATLSNANIFCASITDIPHWVYLQSFRWEVNKPIIKVFAFACIPSGLWVLQLWILSEFNVSQRKNLETSLFPSALDSHYPSCPSWSAMFLVLIIIVDNTRPRRRLAWKDKM